MDPTPLQTEADYRNTLPVLYELLSLDPAPGAPEDQQLIALARLVEQYETRYLLPVAADLCRVAKRHYDKDHKPIPTPPVKPQWERRRLRFALGLRTPMTDDDRLYLRNTVSVEKPDAVRVNEVPQPWQDELREYMRMNCIPVFNEDGEGDCIFAWDWADWLEGRMPDIP